MSRRRADDAPVSLGRAIVLALIEHVAPEVIKQVGEVWQERYRAGRESKRRD